MKNRWLWVVAGIGILGGAWFFLSRNGEQKKEIEYTYAPATEGELIRSTSSVGTLVPFTRVDVKSKAGGRVDSLLVLEGRVVKQGDLIALIDPTDTKSIYDQADADLKSSESRVTLASTNADLEAKNSETRIKEAEIALKLAELRLERAKTDAKVQPSLTTSELQRAQAEVKAQTEALSQFDLVEQPQRKRDAEAQVKRSEIELQNAESELNRQKALLEKGYVSRASMERAQTAREVAASTNSTAQQRLSTLQAAVSSERKALAARLEQAQAALRTAEANRSKDVQADRAVQEAARALDQARLDLRQAKDLALQVRAKQIEIQTAQSSMVRSRVAAGNALDNLTQTKVLAPRPGVVTKKYLEEGTIIPGAVSAFAEGTSIVEISDVTTMYVECRVDEADIAMLKVGQKARIIVEAYPGSFVTGVVERIFPAAETENNVTSVKTRVKVDAQGLKVPGKPLRPGMNATVEFLHMQKDKVLIVPAAAVMREDGKTFVRIKGAIPTEPEKKEVKLGEVGNEGIEVLEGLKAGEEVVIAEVDLAAMRERQDKMQRAQQGGLGAGRPSGPSQSRAGFGGAARPAGGGAGR